ANVRFWHKADISRCPLFVRFWGVKRTWPSNDVRSAYDPKRTFGPEDCCHANDGGTPFRRWPIPAVIWSPVTDSRRAPESSIHPALAPFGSGFSGIASTGVRPSA